LGYNISQMKKTGSSTQLSSLPWGEIEKLLQTFEVSDKVSKVPLETFQFAADKENREFLITSALKSLKKSDPKNATQKAAESLADMMNIFARMVIEEYQNRHPSEELTK